MISIPEDLFELLNSNHYEDQSLLVCAITDAVKLVIRVFSLEKSQGRIQLHLGLPFTISQFSLHTGLCWEKIQAPTPSINTGVQVWVVLHPPTGKDAHLSQVIFVYVAFDKCSSKILTSHCLLCLLHCQQNKNFTSITSGKSRIMRPWSVLRPVKAQKRWQTIVLRGDSLFIYLEWLKAFLWNVIMSLS